VLAWFIFVFLLTRYVSLASISSSLVFAVLVIFVFHETNQLLIILATAIAIFLPLTHHKNIKRLLKGEESKLTFKKQNKAPCS
jgi:glycerol-3-phosphate acyltransferase PlsY